MEFPAEQAGVRDRRWGSGAGGHSQPGALECCPEVLALTHWVPREFGVTWDMLASPASAALPPGASAGTPVSTETITGYRARENRLPTDGW